MRMRVSPVCKCMVALLLLLTGCAPLWELEFENMTGTELVVTRIDSDGGETDYVLPIGGAAVVPTPTRLRIKHADGVSDYDDLGRIPRNFWSRAGVNRIRAKLRVMTDGSLHLVSPELGTG